MTTFHGSLTAKLRPSALSIAVALACGGVAYAQDTPPQDVEEVTVTGTRIRRTDGMAEPTPVTTLTPQELQLFEPGSTIAEQLDALPQFFSTGTAQRGGPALFGDGGGSYLNMRGLGRDRTLVLFDGSRVVPADKRGQVNVDTLPTALVRSIDVVTGGASAAYGADALGGVTNFILDREFEGVKLSVSTGMNEFDSDGQNWNMSFAGGTEIGDRINIIGSFEARHVDEISRNPADLDPSWFQRWGHVNNPAYRATDPPGTNPQRLTVPWVAPRGLHVNGKIGSFPFGVPASSALSGMRFTDDGSALVPFDNGDVFDGSFVSGGADALTSHLTQPGGPSGSEVEQQNAFLGVKFAVTDTVEVFADLMLGSVESNSTPTFGGATMSGPWSAYIFRQNAYLPASVAAIMDTENRQELRIAKAGSVLGELDVDNNGTSHNDFDTESIRVGIDWSMNDNWDLQFSWQSGRSEKLTSEFDSLRVDRVALAMDAVEVYADRRDANADGIIDLVAAPDRGTGTIVCNVQRYNPTAAQLAATPAIQGAVSSRDPNLPLASPIGLDNSISECVPFNIMGHGQISPAAADYIMTPKWGEGIVEQDFAELLVTGQVSDGWGAGPISLATGLTYRDQSFSDEGFPADVDELGPPFNAPELGIRGIASTWSGGSPNLHQFSTVSLISGQYDVWEVFGELNAPIWESSSENQHLGTSFAYRSSDYSSVGRVEAWKIGLDFQVVRDLRLRATKSRDVREATFSERFDNSPGGGQVNDPANGGAPATITLTSAGNPNLAPEKADTTVVGLVYEPSWAEGLRMSFDRYEVDISESIATLGAQTVVNECYNNLVLCENVVRDNTGTLSRVFNPYLNLDQAKVRGTDFEVVYSRDVDLFSSREESFSLRLLGGTLDTRTNTVAGSVPDELAGARSVFGTFPELTGNLTASYRIGPWSVQLQEQYLDEVLLDRTWVEGVHVDDNTVSSQAWTNLVLGYQGDTRGGGAWRVTFNVQNLFDEDPPIIPASSTRFGAQIVDNAYDVWGRRFQIGFSIDL